MNGIKTITSLAIGCTVGSVATYFLVKDKIEKQYADNLQESRKQLKNYYDNLLKEHNIVEETKTAPQDKLDDAEKEPVVEENSINTYKSEKENEDYTKYSYTAHNLDDDEEPYVIEPSMYREIEDYECVTLFYYADKYVADGDLQTVDIDETIGYDSLNHFGEYEEDSVYVRNDELMTDFEVIMDARKFKDIYSGN